MTDTQLYLVTPPAFAPAAFASLLAQALDAIPVACVELRLASTDEGTWRTSIDALRPVAQDRGAAFLLAGRPDLALDTGCDGTALPDPALYPSARKTLGAGYIVGAWVGSSRHDAMVVGERGADFIGFTADPEIVGWWAELFEVPCVAGNGITKDNAPLLARVGADFLALDAAVWDHAAGAAAGLREIAAALGR